MSVEFNSTFCLSSGQVRVVWYDTLNYIRKCVHLTDQKGLIRKLNLIGKVLSFLSPSTLMRLRASAAQLRHCRNLQ